MTYPKIKELIVPYPKNTYNENVEIFGKDWKENFYEYDIQKVKNKLGYDNIKEYYDFIGGGDCTFVILAPIGVVRDPELDSYIFDGWRGSNALHWNKNDGFLFLIENPQTHEEKWYNLSELIYLIDKPHTDFPYDDGFLKRCKANIILETT